MKGGTPLCVPLRPSALRYERAAIHINSSPNYLRFRTPVASGSELKGLLDGTKQPHAGDVDVRLNAPTLHPKSRLSRKKFEELNN